MFEAPFTNVQEMKNFTRHEPVPGCGHHPRGAAGRPIAPAATTHTITVRVSTFRTLKGFLRCRLYSRGDGFPGKPPFDAEQSVVVNAKTMTCTFPGVVAGSYAVALFHDENGDGKLNTNLVGIPSEGVGTSNNKHRSFGPPKWDDATFPLTGDLVLDVNLLY
jgi:uncharacterized protein (DUF2141 family)